MPAEPRTNVVGTFADVEQANIAADALRDQGFSQESIVVSTIETDADELEQPVENGACIGSLGGAAVGAMIVADIATGVLPVAGLAATTTAGAVLIGSANGALAGTAIGAAVNGPERLPEEESDPSGRVAVTVAADGRAPEAAKILRDEGAKDAQSVAG